MSETALFAAPLAMTVCCSARASERLALTVTLNREIQPREALALAACLVEDARLDDDLGWIEAVLIAIASRALRVPLGATTRLLSTIRYRGAAS